MIDGASTEKKTNKQTKNKTKQKTKLNKLNKKKFKW